MADEIREDALAAMCHFLEDIVSSAKGIDDDARLARPFVKYLVGPPNSALRRRTLDALEVVREKGREVGSAAEAVMGLHPCRPSYGAGETGRAVGSAAGGIAASAAVSAAGAPMLAPVVAPIGAKLGGEAGAAVEVEGRKQFKAMYGAMADYGAVFANRPGATGLAERWQAAGRSAFVYFDPSRPQRVPLLTEEQFAAKVVEAEVRGLPLPKLPRSQTGMWVVEPGEPTEAEDVLIKEGKVVVVRGPADVPADPEHDIVLLFPAKPSFGASMERPTLLDFAVDAEFGDAEYGRGMGALFTAAAEAKVPCGCVEIPPEHPEKGEAAKQICTRPGAVGLLSQAQVRERCSEIEPKANGRLDRAIALREAQAACKVQVEGIADKGRRFGARVECLRDVLPLLSKGRAE